MVTLGLDCATGGCSAALLRNGEVLAARSEPMARGQAERLLPLIGEVLDAAGVRPERLDRIGATAGPGGFTGIRIGLAAARGLALVCRATVLGVPTELALAASLPDGPPPILAVIEAKRAEVFACLIGVWHAPELLAPAALAERLPDGPLRVIGDGAPRLRAALADRPDVMWVAGDGLPDAALVARLAETGDPTLWPPRPRYFKAPDVTRPRPAP